MMARFPILFRLLFLLFLFSVVISCDSIEDDNVFDERNSITGSYLMDEYSQTYNSDFSYEIEILKTNKNDNSVYLSNFYDSEILVEAFIENKKVFIPFQQINDYEVEGVGTVYGNVIEFSYSVFDLQSNESFPDYCSTVATKTK